MALSSIFKITGVIVWHSCPGFKMCCSYSFCYGLYDFYCTKVFSLLASWRPHCSTAYFLWDL